MISGDLETENTGKYEVHFGFESGKKKESGTFLGADVWLKEHVARLIWGQVPTFLRLN